MLMNIQKFTAATAHAATQEVRKALGREAIIISNRSTPDGVEIVATDSLDDLNADLSALSSNAEIPGAESQSTQTRKSEHKKSKVSVSDSSHIDENAVASTASGHLRAIELQREIADLHGALEGLAGSRALTATSNITEITLAGRLAGCGLGPAMVQQLVEQARPVTQVDSAWQKSQKNIKKQLRFKAGDFVNEGGTYFFHGSSGAGKTTALCKLAMEFLTIHSPGKLAIVSTGVNPSVGSDNSLLTGFSQLLHLPVHRAKSPEELEHVLRQLRRKKLILIDTPAFDPNNLHVLNNPVAKHQSKRRVEHCLVVSASMQGGLLDHVFACLAESPIESVILTRVDETRQVGIAIDSILRSGMQLRYCSDTPDLHCILHSAAAEVLMSRLNAFSPLSSDLITSESLAKNGASPVANWLESAILV